MVSFTVGRISQGNCMATISDWKGSWPISGTSLGKMVWCRFAHSLPPRLVAGATYNQPKYFQLHQAEWKITVLWTIFTWPLTHSVCAWRRLQNSFHNWVKKSGHWEWNENHVSRGRRANSSSTTTIWPSCCCCWPFAPDHLWKVVPLVPMQTLGGPHIFPFSHLFVASASCSFPCWSILISYWSILIQKPSAYPMNRGGIRNEPGKTLTGKPHPLECHQATWTLNPQCDWRSPMGKSSLKLEKWHIVK